MSKRNIFISDTNIKLPRASLSTSSLSTSFMTCEEGVGETLETQTTDTTEITKQIKKTTRIRMTETTSDFPLRRPVEYNYQEEKKASDGDFEKNNCFYNKTTSRIASTRAGRNMKGTFLCSLPNLDDSSPSSSDLQKKEESTTQKMTVDKEQQRKINQKSRQENSKPSIHKDDKKKLCLEKALPPTIAPRTASISKEQNRKQLVSLFSQEISCLISGMSKKETPLSLKSWVALSLTLDGRDKITKLIQYLCKFIGWYYESLFLSSSSSENNLLQKANRFRKLQKSLTESRKAYRLGRTIVELEKLKDLGLIYWIKWNLLNVVINQGETSQGISTFGQGYVQRKQQQEGQREEKVTFNSRTRLPETRDSEETNDNVILESEDLGNDVKSSGNIDTNKTSALRCKSSAQRLVLPRSLLSNIGLTNESKARQKHTNTNTIESWYQRSLSSIGRTMYRSLSILTLVDEKPKNSNIYNQSNFEIIANFLKLIGLAGFWAGDNINFLYSSGFLLDHEDSYSDVEVKRITKGKTCDKRKNVAAKFAARSYFFAAVMGLFLNGREWLRHKSGPLEEAMRECTRCSLEEKASGTGHNSQSINKVGEENRPNVNLELKEHYYEERLKNHTYTLEKVKQRHFILSLALLKSCCDVIAFSNNPGVDLHKRFRGKKMNEGLHSICGIVSALTVLFNNFPDAKKTVRSDNYWFL